uniref:Putative secreted protein n=1 Tax=Anopheles marajoara TaxID=58244 RepID=A0A2M4C795_9DIPT
MIKCLQKSYNPRWLLLLLLPRSFLGMQCQRAQRCKGSEHKSAQRIVKAGWCRTAIVRAVGRSRGMIHFLITHTTPCVSQTVTNERGTPVSGAPSQPISLSRPRVFCRNCRAAAQQRSLPLGT